MAVTLFDTMRPIAIAGGIGAGYSLAAPYGLRTTVLAVTAGLVAGIIAFIASQKLGRRLLTPSGARTAPMLSSDVATGTFFLLVFVALVGLPLLACYVTRQVLTHA